MVESGGEGGKYLIFNLMVHYLFLGVFTEPEHLFGHEPFPDVTKMTDEELHIPPIQ